MGRRIGSPGCWIPGSLSPCAGGLLGAARCGSPTSTRAAVSGSTRSHACSKTSPSTTCRRPAGGRRRISGSCGGSGSTCYEPFLQDHEVELTTWCSGLAAIAAGRRWSLTRRRRRARGGRQRLDPSRSRPATGQDRGLRRLRRRNGWPARVDEARVARSSGRCSAVALVSACDRHRPARSSEQRDLLAGGRARACLAAPRPCAAARGGARLPRADRCRRRGRARRGSDRAVGCSWAFVHPTGSGLWRAWKLDSVAPGGASRVDL